MARSFRLTMPDPDELDIHESCAQALDKLLLPPAFWFAYPAGHVKLNGAQVARLARIGLKPGLPDIWILYQALLFGIELKTRAGKLSKTRIGRTRRGAPRLYLGQNDVFPKLEAAGTTIAICRSVDDMLAQVYAWGIPMRPILYWTNPLGAAEKVAGS